MSTILYVIHYDGVDAIENAGVYGVVSTRRNAELLVDQLNIESTLYAYDLEWVYNRDDEVKEDA